MAPVPGSRVPIRADKILPQGRPDVSCPTVGAHGQDTCRPVDQHAMHNAATERRAFRKVRVRVQRVGVTADEGKRGHLLLMP
jgi:hypothetical protein